MSATKSLAPLREKGNASARSHRPSKIVIRRHDLPNEHLILPWSDKRLVGIDIACLPTALAHCYFPRRPTTEGAVLRRNGDVSLILEARSLEIDGKLVKPGLPYGAGGRLLFAGLTTLAKLQLAIAPELSPRLYLPRSGRAMYRFTHGDKAANGPDRSRFLQQFYRVLSTEWTATKRARVEMQDHRGRPRVQMGWGFEAVRLIDKGCLWWNPSDIDAMPMFPSWLELSPQMWDWISKSEVPLDWHAYRGLAASPLTMDLVAWLAGRLLLVDPKEPVFLTWEQLYQQFVGQRPERLADRPWKVRVCKFKWDLLACLKQALKVYSRARVHAETDGVRLHHSQPWVNPTRALEKVRLAVEPDLSLP
jgi:hypothetical protein